MVFEESGSFLSDEFVIKMGKQIKNVTKQTVEIRPSNSQSTYTNDQRILFQIPYSSTFSLKDIALHFNGETSGAVTIAGSDVASYLFPKDMNIFADVIIRINGKIVSSFSNRYGDVAALMGNLKSKTNASRKILQNGCPESKQYLKANGDINIVEGMVLGADAEEKSDKGSYVITQFEGLLGNTASSSFVDSRILGEMTIEFVLAPASVLIFGDDSQTKSTRKGYMMPTASYTLSDVKLSLQRYNLDSDYYSAIDKNLSSGSTYKIAFDHYDLFTKNAQSQNDSLMFNLNCHDIKYMYGFFSHSDRDYAQHPQAGHKPEIDKFFNAYWYDYEAMAFTSSQYQVGSTLIPQNPAGSTECMNELIRMQNLKQDNSADNLYHWESLANFRKHYFVAPLSFEFSEDNSNGRIISGLSSSGLPLAISWNYQLGSSPVFKNANVLVASTRILTINNGAVVDILL
jgi:hypothetical protein